MIELLLFALLIASLLLLAFGYSRGSLIPTLVALVVVVVRLLEVVR